MRFDDTDVTAVHQTQAVEENLIHRPTFVVTAKKEDGRRIPQLQIGQVEESLKRRETTINVIAQKKIGRDSRKTGRCRKHTEKIEKLAVDIANNKDGRGKVKNIWFGKKKRGKAAEKIGIKSLFNADVLPQFRSELRLEFQLEFRRRKSEERVQHE
jgi:hypothetical protein